jgi:hypothetical protein
VLHFTFHLKVLLHQDESENNDNYSNNNLILLELKFSVYAVCLLYFADKLCRFPADILLHSSDSYFGQTRMEWMVCRGIYCSIGNGQNQRGTHLTHFFPSKFLHIYNLFCRVSQPIKRCHCYGHDLNVYGVHSILQCTSWRLFLLLVSNMGAMGSKRFEAIEHISAAAVSQYIGYLYCCNSPTLWRLKLRV